MRICLEQSAFPGVIRVTEKVAHDVELVSGKKPQILVNYEKTDRENLGLEVPPKGKHVFGMVKVGDKGQIVIPANARKIFDIQPGDNLLILGDEEQGIAILKEKSFLEHLRLMERLRHMEANE